MAFICGTVEDGVVQRLDRLNMPYILSAYSVCVFRWLGSGVCFAVAKCVSESATHWFRRTNETSTTDREGGNRASETGTDCAGNGQQTVSSNAR